MDLNVKLIVLGSVLFVSVTIYAFSGFKLIGTCEACSQIEAENFNSNLDLFPFNDGTQEYTSINFNTLNASDNNVYFFKVPLVCNGASGIGCGSRAKPILLEFGDDNNIDEAWLNRQGTVIALIPSKNANQSALSNTISRVFSRNNIYAEELTSDAYTSALKSFEDRDNWYKGSDVNKLSKEESEVFAQRFITAINEKTTLSEENEEILSKKIGDVFYDFFLNYEKMSDLGDPIAYNERIDEIIDFGEDLLGKGNMPSEDELWKECNSSSSSHSCNADSCGNGSCSH